MRAFIALLLVAVATAKMAPLLKNTEPIPGKYIIKLKAGYDVDRVAASVDGKIGFKWRNAINGFSAELKDNVVNIVRGLESVEYVEEDGVYRTQVTWGIDRIDQRDLPLDNDYSPSGNGAGYTAFIIDTGVLDTHVDFGGRARQLITYVAIGDNVDCNGHGTHCSGTIGSNTYGVANGVQIRGVKVLGCLGSGSTSGVISGVEYVQNNAPASSVASMSLGGGVSTTLDDAVNALVNSGVPCAVAAGNDNGDACLHSPARAASATCVGATDNTDARASYSNYGSCVELFAPGTNIESTWIGDTNTATRIISGTSMATPHVAGAIAIHGNVATLLANTSTNKISDVMGSPNFLLFV